MKKSGFLFAGLFVLSIFTQGCLCAHQGKDAVSQFSTMNALMQGLYETDFDYGRIREYGDFGIGTFNGLDGEMVALDGKFYQVKSDGSVQMVDNSMKSAFCMVKFFNPDKKIESRGETDYASMIEWLEQKISSKNIFYAARIEGKFSYIKARSVPRQEKPYRGLSEAAKAQRIFEFKDIEGTLVGFRFPDYMSEVNMGGWHFHFISKSGASGGH
ncbi:MAG: acetolactate decarboxylase, partial [Candidatus Omnitrophica bacterium]|nr:acetolactate decarboxylase [Candidatus Omnitrophota bacterium]